MVISTNPAAWLRRRLGWGTGTEVVFRKVNLLTVLGVCLSLGRRNMFIPCDQFVVKLLPKSYLEVRILGFALKY